MTGPWSRYRGRPGASGALPVAEAFGRGAGELVDAFVVDVAGVALHPLPGDLVARVRRGEPLPQVLVLHRVAGGGLPAAPDPVGQPLADALLHVLRVGVQHDLAVRLQCLEAGDRR